MADEEKKQTPIIDEIATTRKDIDIFSGWLNRLENPDPTLRTEAKGKGLKLYDEVDRDPHAGSVLQTRYLSIIGKEWEVLPAEGPSAKGRPAAVSREQKVADFVSTVLENFNFTQACHELLQAILYGFFVGEVIWANRNGSWIPAKIISKHPRRFSFTMDRELRLLTPQNMIDGEPVPDRKFILFTFGSSDNPFGKGLGQKLWWPVWFKKNGIKFWLVFLEKFGMPTAVGKYPSGATSEQQTALLDAIDAIQTETGVKIPDSMAIDLLEASRTGKVTYETLCEYMDKQISKAVLGQTASTEGTPGKLGNEQSQEEVRQDILEADADLLCECLNDTLIKWIVDYNFPGVTDYPKLWIRTKEEGDLKPLADRDEILVNKIGIPVGKRYFYDTYGIPEPAEDEEAVQGAGLRAQGPGDSEFSEKKRFSSDQQNIEALVGNSMKKSGAAISGLTDPVKKIIAEAKTLEEVQDRIIASYSDMDKNALADLLARAMFTADLYGRAAMDKELKKQERELIK